MPLCTCRAALPSCFPSHCMKVQSLKPTVPRPAMHDLIARAPERTIHEPHRARVGFADGYHGGSAAKKGGEGSRSQRIVNTLRRDSQAISSTETLWLTAAAKRVGGERAVEHFGKQAVEITASV